MPGIVPILNDIVQARVECFSVSQISLNVLHYRVISVAGGGLPLLQLAQQMVLALGPLYRALMPITAIFQSVTCKNVTPPETVGVRASSITAGNAIGNLLPRQVSALIGYGTNLAGRAQRGRSYVGMISDTFVDASGEFTGAGFAALVNVASQIGPAATYSFGGATTNLQLVIRHPNLVGPPPATNTTDVVYTAPSALLATQRRRGDYGRTNRP